MMMNTIQHTLLNNWHLMRLIRLGLGLFVGYNAWQESSGLVGLLASVLLFQALSNTGCCGAGGCSLPAKPARRGEVEEIVYTEVKAGNKEEVYEAFNWLLRSHPTSFLFSYLSAKLKITSFLGN